jgi:hypothetical protein
MSSEVLGLLGIVLLLGLILLRIPIALAMIVVGAGGFAWLAGALPLLSQLKTIAYGASRPTISRSCRCSC